MFGRPGRMMRRGLMGGGGRGVQMARQVQALMAQGKFAEAGKLCLQFSDQAAQGGFIRPAVNMALLGTRVHSRPTAGRCAECGAACVGFDHECGPAAASDARDADDHRGTAREWFCRTSGGVGKRSGGSIGKSEFEIGSAVWSGTRRARIDPGVLPELRRRTPIRFRGMDRCHECRMSVVRLDGENELSSFRKILKAK
jgi:hypothetical protein